MVEGVRSDHSIEVIWEGDRRYRGGIPGGASLVMDGERKVGPSPVDSLLISLGSCSAIDVVEILAKRRTPVSSLSVRLDFTRALYPPRRLLEVQVHFTVATASEVYHVERAIELSFGKYCSVAASLAPDVLLSWSVEVLPPARSEGAD